MRNLFFSVILFVVLLCISACGNHNSQDFEKKSVTCSISGTELNVLDLDGSGILCVYNDYLFLRESRDTSRLVVYKIDGDSLSRVVGFINKGRGPRDFMYPEYFLSGDSLFVSNSDPTGIKAIFGISLGDISTIGDSKRWKEYKFEESNIQTGMNFVKIGDGQFFISGGEANTKEIFSLADFNQQNRTPIEFWPADSTQGPLHAKQMVYMQSYINCQDGRIVYSNRYAWYMFIARLKGEKLVIDNIIYPRLPQYSIKPDGNISYSIDGELGIKQYTTSKYIYATLGRTRREFQELDSYKGYPITFCDELEVYDWNGKFIDNCQTDIPFSSFAVSSDNRYLFTMSLDLDSKEPVVQRYELNLR